MPTVTLSASARQRRGAAVLLGTVAIAVLASVEFYAAGGGTVRGSGLVLSFLSGMTMLVLPCTLPMVFVIIPLVLRRSLREGLGMTAAFGVGVSITLAAYGAIVAVAGHYLGITAVTRWMWLVGGLATYGFGLAQLGVVPLRIPAYRGPLPRFLAGRGGVVSAFGVGLLLGNAGIGCPCPAWYVLLGGVATSNSPGYGAAIGLTQGFGRVLPILALAVAALLGVDATRAVVRHRITVEKASGASLVVLGAGIVVFLALAHAWWEATVVHAGWNHLLASLGGPALSEIDAGGGPLPAGLWWAPWLFGLLVGVPALVATGRALRRRRAAASPPLETLQLPQVAEPTVGVSP